MKIEVKKEPLKTAIVCLSGNRISLSAKNVRTVDLIYLRKYLLDQLGRSKVDFVSKKTAKEKDIDFFKDIYETNLSDYDEVCLYSATFNPFGGYILSESIEVLKQLYNFTGKIWYFLADPKMPNLDFAQLLKSRLKDGKLKTTNDPEYTGLTSQWLDDWSEKVFPRIATAYPGLDYDIYYNLYSDKIKNVSESRKKTIELAKDYDWFYLPLFDYYAINEKLDLKLKDYNFNEKKYDLVYFGNNRHNERNQIIKKLYSNKNLSKFFIGFNPELENCKFEEYVEHDKLFEMLGKDCLATVVVGDNLHNNNFKTARFFEAMLCDVVAFISTTYDKDKKFIKNEKLKDFIYVSDEDELYNKIQKLKSDENFYREIVSLERKEILEQTKHLKCDEKFV